SISLFLFFLNFSLHAHAENNNKFRFAAIGCMHLGVCDYQDFELAVEKMKEYNPDFVLFLGGMIDPGGEQSVESLWLQFDSVVKKLGVPVHNVPSNCRLGGFSSPPERVALMQRCFEDRYNKSYYSFEHKNNLFIRLDLGYHFDQTKDSDFNQQIDFLNKAIADASRYDNIFIFMHASPSFRDNSGWFQIIHPLIEERVNFVFSSGKHCLDAKKIGDVAYIATGCPPCFLEVSLSKISFFHFLIVDVDGDNVSVQVVPLSAFPIENLGTMSRFENESAHLLHSVVKPSNLNSYERKVFLHPDQVIKALKIKPGMDILDIGAGSGFFTFRLADALKGTGRIFATETDSDMVEYMKKRIEENGYKNVFPVLVDPKGIDRFYKQHSFDLILMSEVYQYLRAPENYFRDLRPSLNKESSLYIIHHKNIYDFTKIEIEDFEDIIKVLILKKEGYPIFQRLDMDVQYFVSDWQGKEVPLQIQEKIINNFNKMLLDRWLLHDLMDYFANKGELTVEGEWSSPLDFFVSERDIQLVKWLFICLDADGVFDQNKKNLTLENREQLRKLNKILLTNIFGIYKFRDLQVDFEPVIYVKKNSIVSTMEKAGYSFVGEYSFLPMHYFLEFGRKE
ncbi:MAG: methyltransferase domain-containing protein, partial [Candidatus Omnitrophota bacterium]